MQIKVITSLVAGQTAVTTEAIDAFISALGDKLGQNYTVSVDTDYGQSLDQADVDVYLVYIGVQAQLTPAQKSKMIIFYAADDVDNLQVGRFVDMLQQLNQH